MLERQGDKGRKKEMFKGLCDWTDIVSDTDISPQNQKRTLGFVYRKLSWFLEPFRPFDLWGRGGGDYPFNTSIQFLFTEILFFLININVRQIILWCINYIEIKCICQINLNGPKTGLAFPLRG